MQFEQELEIILIRKTFLIKVIYSTKVISSNEQSNRQIIKWMNYSLKYNRGLFMEYYDTMGWISFKVLHSAMISWSQLRIRKHRVFKMLQWQRRAVFLWSFLFTYNLVSCLGFDDFFGCFRFVFQLLFRFELVYFLNVWFMSALWTFCLCIEFINRNIRWFYLTKRLNIWNICLSIDKIYLARMIGNSNLEYNVNRTVIWWTFKQVYSFH